jgi:hypothetical protein|tara:strand:- start:714 stop:1523 length:810 start_codon:yes stop_codon:yes gene_type:complete
MTQKRARRETNKFIDYVDSNCKTRTNNRWNKYTFDVDKAYSYFVSLPDKGKRSVVSDKIWNKYPSYCNSTNVSSRRMLGPLIAGVVNRISYSSISGFDVLLKHSAGLFASETLSNSYGSQRIRAAKRLSTSPDVRVRRRCAKIVPVSYLKKMSKDSQESVRNIVINRLGIDNCSDLFLNDNGNWIREQAIQHSDIDSFDYISFIESAILNLKSYNSQDIQRGVGWRDKTVIRSILRRMPAEELLYYLDSGKLDEKSEEIISGRLILNGN